MLDGWREVCRWEVTGDLPLSMETVDWRSAFEDMAAAFEELAGEHRELVADNVHSRPECPGPGWYWVRGHWRSRSASSAPSVELCKTEVGGTDDTDDAVNGPSGASEGQPEVFPPVSNPGQTLWQCEDCGQEEFYHVQLSCGHYVRELRDGIGITHPGQDRDGEPCDISGVYCADCAKAYMRLPGAVEQVESPHA